MNIKIASGLRLKELRKKKKMTQLQLSEISGIERTFISHVEAGTRNVSLQTLKSLCDGLDVSIRHFFNNSSFD